MRTAFDTDMDGIYQLQLVVSNGTTQSEPVTVQINVNSALPLPADMRFDGAIRTVLQANSVGAACTSCHAAGGEPGVPVYYTDPDPVLEPNRNLYEDVITRINFADPLHSKLLSKPSGTGHFGGVIGGFDTNGGNRDNYDLFLTWILQGAPR